MIERSETTVESKLVAFVATDTEGLSAVIESGGTTVAVTCSTIDGFSMLRIPSHMVDSAAALLTAICGDPELVVAEPPVEEAPGEPIPE